MKKNIIGLILLMGLIGCHSKDKVKTHEDRLQDSFILDSIMNQYFSQEDVKDISFFNMGIYVLNDSLYINILPVLQKNDVAKISPNDMLTYKRKKIFVFNKSTDYLPREKKTETMKMYKDMIDNLPMCFNTNKKYHIWYIRLKDNACKIRIVNYIYILNDSKIKFVPPAFKPTSNSTGIN